MALILFTDGVYANRSNWTQRGPRPDYQSAFRSRNVRQLSFTQQQNEALKSEVMCQLVSVLNEGHAKKGV